MLAEPPPVFLATKVHAKTLTLPLDDVTDTETSSVHERSEQTDRKVDDGYGFDKDDGDEHDLCEDC